jgi:transcription elongation factor GreB
MDRRIRYLQKRLPALKVVDDRPEGTDQVFFGAWITLENAAGEESLYRIVGADEFDPKRNWISVDSPMARALLKRRVDDEITVATPAGQVNLVILRVSYTEPE